MNPPVPTSDLPFLEACEGLHDAVYVKDLDGRYLMVNSAAAAVLGLDRQDLIGKTDRELLPEDWETVRGADQKVFSSGESQQLEEPLVIDGELRIYQSTKAPLRDRSGEIIGLIGISTEITARKAAEEELRRREAKLAEAQRIAQVGSWDWDLGRQELTWSKELFRIFGVDTATFRPTYSAFLEAIHTEDRDRVAAAVDEALASGSDYELEFRVVRPDGAVRWMMARAQVFTDLDGAALKMVGAGIDITEQRLNQERLEASEAMLVAAEELTRVGSFRWKIGSDRVSWSEGLHRIFGVRPGGFAGNFEAYLDLVHPDEREARRRAIGEVASSGQPANGEHRIVRPDGEIRWIESRVRALRDKSGEITELVGACQDITERKLAAQELELQMELAQARALKDPVTGLANRNLAIDRLAHAFFLASRHESDVAVLFIDLDGFKRINDSYGHAAGDRVLAAVADRIQEHVRDSDTVARIGGDEFLVVCEQADGAMPALDTAERLQAAFSEPFDCEGSREQLALSIGVSSIEGRKLTSVHQLVDEADQAMYEAKRRGPGQNALFRPEKPTEST